MFFEARHIRPRGDITEHQCYMRCPQCRWSARRDLHASPTHGNDALLLETGSWSCKSTKMYIYENEKAAAVQHSLQASSAHLCSGQQAMRLLQMQGLGWLVAGGCPSTWPACIHLTSVHGRYSFLMPAG